MSGGTARVSGVSFVIPTLNGGPLLRRCLESIRAQDWPADRFEVLVMDGGSTDGTRELAAELGCRVEENPLRLAEPGVKLGLERARHDVRVVMAADNALPGSDWLRRVVDTFERTGAVGVYTHVVDAPIDSPFCRYFNHLHADPFNWFVFGRVAANPARFAEGYPLLEESSDWSIFDLRCGDPPLLALAQGFAVRGELPGEGNDQDDILPLWQLLERGERFAYVDAGMFHHTVEGFADFLRKYRRRTARALAAQDAAHRQRHHRLSPRQRRRRLLWAPYAFTVVGPVVDAARGLVRDRDPVWLWHPLACFGLAAAMVSAAASHLRSRHAR